MEEQKSMKETFQMKTKIFKNVLLTVIVASILVGGGTADISL